MASADLLQLLSLGVTAGVGALAAYAGWKARRAHQMLYEVRDALGGGLQQKLLNEYRQVEALLALYAELKPLAGLGPTRDWAASPDFLLLVARHVLDRKPQRIVECGSGASTVVIARCLQLNGCGHLVSLDHSQEYATLTRTALAHHDLSAWAEVRWAPLREGSYCGRTQPWYKADQIPDGPIDFALVDGPPLSTAHHARFPAGPVLLDRLTVDGVLCLDDYGRNAERSTVQAWLEDRPGFVVDESVAEKGVAWVRRAGLAGIGDGETGRGDDA